MDGIGTIRQRNASDESAKRSASHPDQERRARNDNPGTFAGYQQRERNAAEWRRRAAEAVAAGNYELAGNLTRQAKLESPPGRLH